MTWLQWLCALAIAVLQFVVSHPLPAQTRIVATLRRVECNGQSCANVTYTWRAWSADPRRHYLYRGSVQVGAWCYDRCHWRAFDAAASTWAAPQQHAPVDVPGIEAQALEPGESDAVNFGLAPGRISGTCRYTINGRECSKETQFEALTGGQLLDDSDRWHLTIVGSADERQRVLRDLDQAPALSEFKGQLHVQAYGPDHWAVQQRLLLPLGDGVTLFVRDATGTELARLDGYSDAEGLADRLRKLRAPAPVEPVKPFDGLRDLSALTNWLKRNWLVPLLLLAGGWFLLRRRS